MSVEVDGACDVWRETRRTARKPHDCACCEISIQPGHEYFDCFYLYEGEADTLARCARCQLIIEHLRETMDCDNQPDLRLDCGHVYEDVHHRPPPPWLAALAFWRPEDPLPTAEERNAK